MAKLPQNPPHRNNPPNNPPRNDNPQPQNHQRRDQDQPRNNEPQHFFHNPYTFVPTPARGNVNGFAGDFDPIDKQLVHNKRQDDLWTGELSIEMTVITPLLLIDPNSEEKSGSHNTYNMMKHFESSSIRGVLRSAYETITNSRFGNFRNHQDRLGYRMPQKPFKKTKYDASPEELLDKSLRPAKSKKELSPADRLFGWVAEEKNERESAAYRGRLRVIAGAPPSHPNGAPIEQIQGDALPLAILGTPKPEQGRFYVGEKSGRPLNQGIQKKDTYKKSNHIRGRKHFWHHRDLEAWRNGQLTQAGKTYWKATSEDRTQTQQEVNEEKRRFQEYRKPRGYKEKTDQNRSIKAWIRPGTTYAFSLFVENLQDEELGALLWLLSLPEDYYLRMGYGKPLGFGSIRLSLKNPEVSSMARGKAWHTYYTSFDAPPPAGLSKEEKDRCIDTFKQAMCQGYAPQTSFDKLQFIEAFLQICQGPKTDDPIHYPRLAADERYPPPHREGKNFEWFVENEKQGKYALPAPTDEHALPLRPIQGSTNQGGGGNRQQGSGGGGYQGGGNCPPQGGGVGGSPRPPQSSEKKQSANPSDSSKPLKTKLSSLSDKFHTAKGNPSPPSSQTTKPKK